MWFERDDGEARSDIAEHGVDFVGALRIFEDAATAHVVDETGLPDEERFREIGIANGFVLAVYKERGGRVRLISARKATRREESDHFQQRRSWND